MRCMEQIRNDVCYHNFNINIVSIGGGFSYGSLGTSHQATEDWNDAYYSKYDGMCSGRSY